MSESDGLRKLTEYLQQTKRQAENAIDVLNSRIQELVDENDQLVKVTKELEQDRDHFKLYSEQLKAENATKWKLRERDDWKSLVDSIQTDRNRLQDSCTALEHECDRLQGENTELNEKLHEMTVALDEANAASAAAAEETAKLAAAAGGSGATTVTAAGTTTVEGAQQEEGNDENKESTVRVGGDGKTPVMVTPSKERNERYINCTAANAEMTSSNTGTTKTTASRGSVLLTPIYDRNGKPMPLPESPTALARQLKLELKRAQNQLDVEHRLAAETLSAKAIEISRLKQELQAMRPSPPNSLRGISRMTKDSMHGAAESGDVDGGGSGSWGLWSLLFGGNTPNNAGSCHSAGPGKILYV